MESYENYKKSKGSVKIVRKPRDSEKIISKSTGNRAQTLPNPPETLLQPCRTLPNLVQPCQHLGNPTKNLGEPCQTLRKPCKTLKPHLKLCLNLGKTYKSNLLFSSGNQRSSGSLYPDAVKHPTSISFQLDWLAESKIARDWDAQVNESIQRLMKPLRTPSQIHETLKESIQN